MGRQFRLEGHNTFFPGMLGRHFGEPYNLEMLKLLFVFWRLHFRIQLISVISGLRDLLWTTGQKAHFHTILQLIQGFTRI